MTEQTKQDCFAFAPEDAGCTALRERCCDWGDCPFYKTREQLERELEA